VCERERGREYENGKTTIERFEMVLWNVEAMVEKMINFIELRIE